MDRIGRGGMGSLYLAWDPVLERQIAIKLLREDMEELRERFDREARSVARLRHPNIVTIFDVGEQDGQPFIAMEYIHGQTLAEIIRGEPQPSVSRKLTIIDELCDGLGFAHKMAIIHRDVKPANVMVENEGGVKILDFGIARVAESGMTMAGMLIGTLNYMSPEQISGQVVDNRSDIFAIGAVMYELLSQRQAFPGGLQNGIIHRILNQPPAPLEAFCPTLDEEVIEIVHRALEKDAQARYQDLAAMRRDLQRVRQKVDTLAGEAVVANPETSGETVVVERPEKKSSHPGRRATPREALARLRATQLAAHLEAAQRAFDDGDYDGAVSSAEHALLLDPEDPKAAEIIDRARAVLDELSVQDLVKRAAELVDAGSLTEALGLCEQALTIAPGSPAAVELRDTLDRRRLERDRERQRVESARAATARAERCLATGNYEDAIAAAEEALQDSPDHGGARRVRQQALQELERTRKEARDKLAACTTEDARRAFDAGEHDRALGILAAFEGEHSHVAETLEALRREKARLEREAERARREQVNDAVTRASAEPSHEAAIEHLRSALAVDPSRTDVSKLLADRQHALDIEREEARQARLREQQIADGLARAAAEASHEAAIAILEPLLPLGPDRQDLREALENRRSALDRQREAGRARQKQVDDAIARAKAEASHEAAIEHLRSALAVDPSRTDVSKLLADRQHALDIEREEARQARLREAERARRQQVDGTVARAKAEASHEAAIEHLRSALAVDPSRTDVSKLLADRQHALDIEREEARQARLREAERARRQQVDGTVARAKAEASHEAAIEHLRSALAVDPSRTDVSKLLADRQHALDVEREEARQARLREERIADGLKRAAAEASHEAAIAILEPLLPLGPDRQDLREALESRRIALDRQREEARRAGELRRNVNALLSKAQNTADHEAAIGVLRQALELDPDRRDVEQALHAREAELQRQLEERRRAEEREALIAAAIKDADATDSDGEALRILKAVLPAGPAHSQLKTAIERRQAALERKREEARKEREKQARVADAVAKASAAASHDGAIALLTAALQKDPGDPGLTRVLEERREALERQKREERARREREERARRERTAEALKRARNTPSDAEAVTVLEQAAAQDPEHAELRAALSDRRAALAEEREQARRERERQERVETAIRDAKAASHTEAALRVLKSALTLAPDHEGLRKIVATTEARLAREQEEARQLRERQARVAALLNQAKATPSHERALELLREILTLEPSNREAKELKQRRESALEQERAAARRLADIEAARRSIAQFIARGDLARAETALKEAERTLSAGKLLKAERARLKEARRAAKRSTPGPAPSGLRPAVVAALAAAAAVILIVGYVAFGPSSSPNSGSTTTAQPPATTGPSTAPSTAPTTTPPGNTAAGPTKPEVPAEAVPNPEPAPAPPPPAPTIDPRLAGATNAARESLKRGDLQGAAASVTRGLKIAPQSQELQDLARSVVNQARQATSDARRSATARGEASTSSPAFRDAQSRQADAGRRERANQHDPAVRLYLEAAKLYSEAARVAPPTRPEPTPPAPEAKKPVTPPTPSPVPSPAPPTPQPGAGAGSEKPAPPATGTGAGTPSAGAATSPAKPEPKPTPPPPAQSSVAAEEAAIRATLREYAAAQSAMDVAAVQRVHPSVNAATLLKNFSNLRSQTVEILRCDPITINGTNAVVRCVLGQSITPRIGSRQNENRPSEFRLRKEGSRWVIVDRR